MDTTNFFSDVQVNFYNIIYFILQETKITHTLKTRFMQNSYSPSWCFSDTLLKDSYQG
jgi:hypothetical protein